MRKLLQVALSALAIACCASSAANAGTFSLLHVFPAVEGSGPTGALVQDAAGNLYSTTSGAAYELTPPSPGKTKWGYQEIHTFTGAPSDGAVPVGVLTLDHNGNLYGVTQSGGSSMKCGGGCGTVFELTLSGGTWTETVLHSFTNGTDGMTPQSGLVLDAAGNLYGTTVGLNFSSGTVFELSPPTTGNVWPLKTLHRFCPSTKTCVDGYDPESAKLVFDNVGNLYGATYSGGVTANEDGGVIFELSPPAEGKTNWREKILYSDPAHSKGPANFSSGLVFINGALYGSSQGGGTYDQGTVFSLTPSGKTWTMATLYNFRGPHGTEPQSESGLILDSTGNLYGTTFYGAPNTNTYGTVFKFAYGTDVLQTLHTFKGGAHDGANPVDGLIFDKLSGDLLGTTSTGGADDGGGGTVFKLVP